MGASFFFSGISATTASVVSIKPAIEAEYGLAELPAALDHLARGPFGKVVICGATGERAVWFRDCEGNLIGIGQPIR